MMRASLPLIAAVSLWACSPNSQAPDSPTAPDTATLPDSVAGLAAGERKAFVGDRDTLDGAHVARVQIAPFEDERLLLDGNIHGFAEAGKRHFPEIGRVPFKVEKGVSTDPEEEAMYRDSFYAGLYYAEMIHLADGRSLFDLVTKCATVLQSPAGANLDLSGKAPVVAIQFFPNFRMVGTPQDTDLQILLDKTGNMVTARSALFSSDILTDPAYLAHHGVACMR